MVLRITVINAGFLREAVQAVPVAGSGMVIIIWSPEYFAVQSVFAEKMPEGENPLTLLKIVPEGFSAYDSTDRFFNAAIEATELEAVFHTAKDSDPIEFYQSVEDDNGLNEFGYLHARFNRPVDLAAGLVSGAFMNDYIPMKIYGIFPERVLQAADVSHDPSLIQYPPAAVFVSRHFAHYIATLETFGMTATITVLDNEVFFTTEARPLDPLIMPQKAGLISTRKDCSVKPIRFDIHMQNLDIQPGAAVSDEVSLYKRTDTVFLFWFRLATPKTFLKGHIIYYFY
ncbi:PREDICTED: uncharacterized protein LOC109193826 [Ipomoea nil]|uniref:uncharacterized protein LOC109193826 n=1 Tax=Ipomoea nil TaxID=35883 RepID=UPI000900E691|nr:PREDICTED: uncharacterized protein LOC109193826 [Ipomoea nil]